MAFTLKRFLVTGLHGSRDFDVPFVDNRLVIVGENGTGKSTFAKLLFYTLTCQWTKLRHFEFEKIELSINDSAVEILPAQMNAYLERRARLHHHLGPRLRHRLVEATDDIVEEVLAMSPYGV